MASDTNFSYKRNKGLFSIAPKKWYLTPYWLLFCTFFFHPLNGRELSRQLPRMLLSLLTNNLLGWQRCRREKQPPSDDPNHAQPFLEGAENIGTSQKTSLELSCCVPKARGMRLTLTWVIEEWLKRNFSAGEGVEADSSGWSSFQDLQNVRKEKQSQKLLLLQFMEGAM